MLKPARASVMLLALIVLMCLAARTHAQDVNGNPDNWCRNGHFPSYEAEFKVARVGGIKGTRTHFYSDDDGCPAATAKCQTKSYLIPGNEVLVSKRYGSWVCGWYQPRKGEETVGWLAAESLIISSQAAKQPATENWLGQWRYGVQTLNIRRDAKPGLLAVKGEALWRGLGDNVHEGEVEASASPQGNELILNEEVCQVKLRLVGAYLVAGDNSECGGVNVRFNGVYRRGH